MRCECERKHRHHESKEGCVKEALEYIPEMHKVPHSNKTYGKIPRGY